LAPLIDIKSFIQMIYILLRPREWIITRNRKRQRAHSREINKTDFKEEKF